MMDDAEIGKGQARARSSYLPGQGAWGVKQEFFSLKTDKTEGYWHRRITANVCHSGVKASLFAGVGVFALLFYASGIPRIQKDILQVRLCSCLRLQFLSAIAYKPTEGSLHRPQVQEGDPCI